MDTARKVVEGEKFKSFNDTYNQCAFALAVGLIYPNKATLRVRIILIILTIAINFLELYWFGCYLYKCIIRLDIYNFTRNMTVGSVISLFLFKSFYVNYKTIEFGKLLQEITDDLLRGNELSKDQQNLYDIFINRAKVAQAIWVVIPVLLSTQFTVYSGICMIYEYMNTDLYTRYMVHEMELQHIQHLQYETPYFELIYAYNCIQSIILSPNFCGFDGSFCIATTHMCLKLKIIAHSMQTAFRDIISREELRIKVKNLVKEHQKALMFYRNMQNVYGTWLFIVFLLTSLIISFSVFQIYYIQKVDPKYTIFALSGVLHMFLPCYYASNLIQANDEFSTELYSAQWEATRDPILTKYLIFMIARSQESLKITAIGIVVFDMKLFVSILQNSYSFFTLISSR